MTGSHHRDCEHYDKLVQVGCQSTGNRMSAVLTVVVTCATKRYELTGDRCIEVMGHRLIR